MPHPPAHVLSRFVAGEVDEATRAEVERELARCAECRAAVGALARAIPPTSSGDDTLPALSRLEAGELVGERYRVIRALGEGGMGAVHEVEHELLGRRFAMKTLHAPLAREPELVRRFTAEARAAAAIEHPAIVDVVDLGRTDRGVPFLVMELLEGETLDAWLASRPRASVDDALTIGVALASALAAAHARGIVHRDVKPANVFLLARDPSRVKLLDFGIAKLSDAEGRTRSGMLLGTPRYMSPEQWLAAPDVDARADVFALGVLLFRMLAGELPYAWSSVVGPGETPSLRDHAPEAPPALVELVDRCIARDRDARPGDGAAVLAALDGVRAARRRIREGIGEIAPALEPERTAHGRAFVGRDRELAALDAQLGPGRAVAIVGPPGIGKSALLRALALRAPSAIQVRIGREDAAHPMRALARGLSGDPALDGARDVLARAIGRGLDALAENGALLAIDGPLDVEGARALAARLGAPRSRIAVVLAVRDDAEGQAAVAALGAEAFPLRGLDVAGVAELARASGARVDAERLWARTGGSPLFVEQLLALDPSSAHDTAWPADVAAAVRARLAALPDREARAWRVAAVLGSRFEVSDLAALGIEDAGAALDALAAREIVVAVERGWALAADVLREVGYELVPDATRAALHAEIARLRAHAPAPDWIEIARHHDLAREAERARDAYARAALEAIPSLAASRRAELAARAIALGDASLEVALVRADALEMSGSFDAALDALDAAPAVDPRARAEIALRRGVILQRTGRGREALDVLAAAVGHARGGAPPATLARALGKHAVALAYVQELAGARAALIEAERLVLVKAPALRAEAAVWRAQIAGVSGDLGDRRSSYWAAVELYREQGDLRLAAGAAMNLADTYNQLGAYDEAERALTKARAECLGLGVRVMAGYAALNLGYARTELGDHEGAARSLDEASAIARESGEGRLERFATLYRARLDRARGRFAEAIAALEELAAISDDSMRALAESVLARARLESGDPAGALASSERAITILGSLGGLEEGEAELHWAHARSLAANGRGAEAAAARARGAAFVRDLARKIGDPEWRDRLLTDVEAHRALLARDQEETR